MTGEAVEDLSERLMKRQQGRRETTVPGQAWSVFTGGDESTDPYPLQLRQQIRSLQKASGQEVGEAAPAPRGIGGPRASAGTTFNLYGTTILNGSEPGTVRRMLGFA
jgi:hypothetical protein